jgi:hypothetical protein
MPTHAKTTLSLPPRRRGSTSPSWTTGAVVGVVVSMGPVADSGDDAVSLMVPILAAMVMRQ